MQTNIVKMCYIFWPQPVYPAVFLLYMQPQHVVMLYTLSDD